MQFSIEKETYLFLFGRIAITQEPADDGDGNTIVSLAGEEFLDAEALLLSYEKAISSSFLISFCRYWKCRTW